MKQISDKIYKEKEDLYESFFCFSKKKINEFFFKGSKKTGVFPTEINEFRINSIIYVKMKKAFEIFIKILHIFDIFMKIIKREQRLQRKLNFQEIIRKLKEKSPKSPRTKKNAKLHDISKTKSQLFGLHGIVLSQG